jgi:PAS domain S-box-containing protein
LNRQADAHDRRVGELAVRSESWYAQLLDAAPDAIIVVGADGRVDLVNVQMERLFGYSRAELLGRHFELLMPERFRDGHGSHLASFLASPGARAMGSGLELLGRRKDGIELPLEVSLSPLRTADGVTVSAAIRDITERKRTEAAAKLLADRLASGVESIQDAFALFDATDHLVLCNSVYRGFIGDSLPWPIVGRTFETLLDAWLPTVAFVDDAERDRFRAECVTRRLHAQKTFDLRIRDGRSLRVIDRRTAEGGTVETIWDLSDDARAAEALRGARAVAEAASTAKSEFLSSMSHELRTPLNAILGFAQLLRRDKEETLTDRDKGRIEQILQGGRHLLRLIDDILDLARIEAGGVSISPEPIDVGTVLDEVTRTLEPMAAREHIRLADHAPEALPLVAADRTRLAQILMNFVSNAIKYNRPTGAVTFRVSTPDTDRLRVTVADTGMGIPPDKQTKLFQPFQRAGQEAGPIEGTGIGLVIARRLARLMGGDVGFRSVLGQGSEFWVDMPLHASGARSSVPPAAREESSGQVPSEGRRRVLYIEDNPANVAFMVDLVSTVEDVELITAPTAEMGLELAHERRPDVIILDITLPGMSGVDALRALRALAATRDIPVIALTAAATEIDKRRGREAGFDRYLTKPVKVDDFVAALNALLAFR